MDRIELARQIAADLHTQAVARGEDPCHPYAFAFAEAQRRGIDVEKMAPGATGLNGGRAIFIPSDALIIHENAGSPFEQAVLVVHEIGHAELGDDRPPEPARNVDPARSAEPSPNGIDRVVDYSPRQRREVQMDLFAREFLLPRDVVRSLHVEQGLTASQIAEKFGAPFEIVVQQLFDALLLPSIAQPTEPEKSEFSLNPEQITAANHRGSAYLLEAGPGTGKTQTLTARVEALLAKGVDPRRILLLTFSNRAADEMVARLALRHKDAACAMWIGTFHAFGLDVIRRFHTDLGLPQNPRLLDRTDAVELLEQEFPRLNLVHYRNLYDPTRTIANILTAISRAKDEVTDAQRYAKLAAAMLDRAATPSEQAIAEKAIEVARVYEAYETLKLQSGCIDFGDLVMLPVLLLEKNANLQNHFRSQYDHVLVDEYQDVNRSSVRLLKLLCGDGKNLWAVGDAKQSIYRFRGASSFNIARFGKEDFSGGQRGRLKQNYRSNEEIVSLFSTFAMTMTIGDTNSELEAQRQNSGYAPTLYTVDRSDQQTVALADAILAMQTQGYRYRDQVVLCTGNEKLSKLGQNLERLGVPVLFLGSLFERPEVKDLLALLSMLSDQRVMGLVRVACWSEFEMLLPDVAAVIDFMREQEDGAIDWCPEPTAISDLSEAGRTTLTKIAEMLAGFSECSSPWMVLATVLLDRTRIAAKIAASDNISDRSRGIALWQLMNFIRTQPAAQGLPIPRLLNRVRRLVILGDDRELRQLPAAAQGLDAVRLMTIHGSKGLEFPVIHLPGMNVNTLPRTSQPPPCPVPDDMVEGSQGTAQSLFRSEQELEQECLFYVALSRARDRIFLYAPTQKANGHRLGLSPFLNRLGQRLEQQHITPDRSLPQALEDKAIELRIEGGLQFSASQIAQYESCPRRFFYTHVLQLGGRRKETALMRIHEVVRIVTQALVAEGMVISDGENLEQRIWETMVTYDLSNHGYVEELKTIAANMLQFFMAQRVGLTPEALTTLKLPFDNETITVRPDDVLVSPEGKKVIRRIQTRRMRSDDLKAIEAASFVIATQQAFPDATVEFVYLSDQTTQSITFSTRELQTRQTKLVKFLADIRCGHFPTKPSQTCPNCPAFFICGPTPAGVLKKNQTDLPV